MLQALSIAVREGFEAALVIGIMLTYAAKTGRSELKSPLAWGVISAVIASVVGAFALSSIGINPDTPIVEGYLYLTAGLFVVSMVVWMQRAGGNIHRKVTEGVERASAHSTTSTLAVGAFAFFMVAREGVEGVLLLTASALDQGVAATLAGTAVGLTVAVALGAAIYYGAARIDMKLFFTATSIALLLLATRFIGIGILEFGEAGVLALPEFVEEGLELLEEGALATLVNLAVLGLPLGALSWSLLRHRSAGAAA